MRLTKSIESVHDRWSVHLIFLSVLFGLVYQSFQTLVSDSFAFFVILLSNATGWLGCYLFLSSHKLPKISRLFVRIVVYLFILGCLYGSIFDKESLTLALIQDFRYVMYLMSGCVFAYSYNYMESFHNIMKVVSVFAIISGLYALLHFDYSYTSLVKRESTWSLSYLLWWSAGSCWVYWALYALFVRRDLVFAIGPAIVYIILGSLFLKREVFAYIFLIFIVYLFFERKHKGLVLKTLLVVAGIIVLIYSIAPELFGDIFDMLMNRFTEVEDLDDFDRNIETSKYFEEASIFQIVFGNGMGHFHIFKDSFWAETRGPLNALHLGYTNVLYKGGIILVVFYLYLFSKIIKRMRCNSLSPYLKVCLGASFVYFASLFFAGSWTYTIEPFCTAAPLFYAATRDFR